MPGDSNSDENRPIIMIVDDASDIRAVCSQIIRFLGGQAVTAVNGAEALNLLKNGLRPQLILLDLMMPIKDGWQTELELGQDPVFSKIPTVIISATEKLSKDLSRNLEVIKKPISIERLKLVYQSTVLNDNNNYFTQLDNKL